MNEEELIIKELFTEKDFIVYNLGLRKQLKKAIKVSFQKGELKQKKIKKELFWVYTNILEDFGEWDKIEIEKRIKQLQKEIGEEKQDD